VDGGAERRSNPLVTYGSSGNLDEPFLDLGPFGPVGLVTASFGLRSSPPERASNLSRPRSTSSWLPSQERTQFRYRGPQARLARGRPLSSLSAPLAVSPQTYPKKPLETPVMAGARDPIRAVPDFIRLQGRLARAS